MSLTNKMILILILLLPGIGALSAQETPTTTAPTTATETTDTTGTTATSTEAPVTDPPTTTTAPLNVEQDENYELRNKFTRMLQRHPRDVTHVLILEPSLLGNQQFLSEYPELARFVAAHPELLQNASFYLGEFADPRNRNSVLEEILEPLSIVAVFSLIAFALSWLVRTLIEQKRWNRLSRTQAEVHNKILDRFSTSNELLDYIKTPAGSKFLESAPIPLHSEPVHRPAPFTRVIWSIQIGVVLAAAAIGLLLVSLRFDGESGRELFALGVIALFLGLGFAGSAAVSIVLSRRLGVWQSQTSLTPDS
jgi:hypothetical protein